MRGQAVVERGPLERRDVAVAVGERLISAGSLAHLVCAACPSRSGTSASSATTYPRQAAHVVLNFHSTREMGRSFRTHVAVARLLATVT